MNKVEQAEKELARAKKALQAAKTLLESQLYEDCVSSTSTSRRIGLPKEFLMRKSLFRESKNSYQKADFFNEDYEIIAPITSKAATMAKTDKATI